MEIHESYIVLICVESRFQHNHQSLNPTRAQHIVNAHVVVRFCGIYTRAVVYKVVT